VYDYTFYYIYEKIKVIPFEYLINYIDIDLADKLIENINAYNIVDKNLVITILKNIIFHYENQELRGLLNKRLYNK
jgi:hypothetical protein